MPATNILKTISLSGERLRVSALAFAAALAIPSGPITASESCNADAMIVFDGSGSMAEINSSMPRARILDARDAIRQAMPMIAPFRKVGLIVFGPTEVRVAGAEPKKQTTSTDRCRNINLLFAPEEDAGLRVIDAVNSVRPRGETPLTEAVSQAAEVLDYQNKPAMIVLVADGVETCGGSPCHLAGQLAASAHDLTVHVIGFRVRKGLYSWNEKAEDQATVAECLSVANGGQYVSAESVEDLAAALEKTLSCNTLSRAAPGRSLFRRQG